MNLWRSLLAVLVLLVTPLALRAAPLDAPTGAYSGTLVHERRLSLSNTDPLRVVTFKQKTKVAGFGAVVGARTVIRLIVPPRGHTDEGLDRFMVLDFNPDPPIIQIGDGLNFVTVGFPTFTVEGNVVTVVTTNGVSGGPFTTEETNTLKIKRTKP